jgi:ribonuclease P protein subunit POP4
LKITPAILQHEFIGLKVKVVKSTNPNNVGIEGTIIDETRNTFKVQHEDHMKMLIKKENMFHFMWPDGTVLEIDGKMVVGRPEERVKKRVRRLW